MYFNGSETCWSIDIDPNLLLCVLTRNAFGVFWFFFRKSVGIWIPALILYVCSIYSGSVALANLVSDLKKNKKKK